MKALLSFPKIQKFLKKYQKWKAEAAYIQRLKVYHLKTA
jgi:hypothetical protein